MSLRFTCILTHIQIPITGGLKHNKKDRFFNNESKPSEDYIKVHLEKLGIKMDFFKKTPKALNMKKR